MKTKINTIENLREVLISYVNKPELYKEFNELYDYSQIENMGNLFYVFPSDDVKYEIFRSMTSIPPLDTNSVTDMSGMFNGCENLKEIPELDTSNVKNTSYMFYKCEKLEKIPNLDTSKVKYMEGMFGECKSITTIPNLNTSSVEDMSKILMGCESLESIPNLNIPLTANVYYSLKNTKFHKNDFSEIRYYILNKQEKLEMNRSLKKQISEMKILNTPKLSTNPNMSYLNRTPFSL